MWSHVKPCEAMATRSAVRQCLVMFGQSIRHSKKNRGTQWLPWSSCARVWSSSMRTTQPWRRPTCRQRTVNNRQQLQQLPFQQQQFPRRPHATPRDSWPVAPAPEKPLQSPEIENWTTAYDCLSTWMHGQCHVMWVILIHFESNMEVKKHFDSSNHWDAKEFGNVLIPALKGLLHSHLTVFLDGKCQTSDVDISGPLEVVQCGKPQDERTYPKPSETNAGGCNGATPLGPWLQSSNLALKQHNQILQHCKVFQHCMFWESCSTHPALKQTSGKLKQTRHIWYLMENSSLQAFSNFLKICFLVALTLGLRQKHHTENTTSWSADSPWQRPCHKNHSSATIFSDVVCSMFFSRSKLWFRFTMITEWTNSEPAKSACFQMSCLEAASAAALLTLT